MARLLRVLALAALPAAVAAAEDPHKYDQPWRACVSPAVRAKAAARQRGPRRLPQGRVEDDELADKASDVLVTIVTQCDANRLWQLAPICDRWRGPLSLAILVEPGRGAAVKAEARRLTRACSLVRIATRTMDHKSDNAHGYPVNALRNLAMDGRPPATTHAWMMDVDFRPARHSRHALVEAWRAAPENAALVVPAFELEWSGKTKDFSRDDAVVPSTLDELAKCLDRAPKIRIKGGGFKAKTKKGRRLLSGNATAADAAARPRVGGGGAAAVPRRRLLAAKPGPKPPHCRAFHHHGTTRFARWLVDSYLGGPLVRRLPCIHGDHFEPFLAVPVCATPGERAPADRAPPRFDERFEGYGKNKIDWVAGLRHFNYSFLVARDAYAIHVQHETSLANKVWQKTHQQGVISKSKGENDALFDEKTRWRVRTRSLKRRLNTPACRSVGCDWALPFIYEIPSYHTQLVQDTVRACLQRGPAACHAQGSREAELWNWLARFKRVPVKDHNMFYTSSSALLVPRGVSGDKISWKVKKTLRTMYPELTEIDIRNAEREVAALAQAHANEGRPGLDPHDIGALLLDMGNEGDVGVPRMPDDMA